MTQLAMNTQQDIATPDNARGVIGFGLAVMFLIFGGFTAWSILAPLEGAVIAPGVVEVHGANKAVQHLEGGIVGQILVKEGELVSQNAVLIRLDGASIEARLSTVDVRLAALLALRIRLITERENGAEIILDDMTQNALEDDRIGERLSENLEGQTSLFSARRSARFAEITVLRQRVQQQRDRIRGLLSEFESKEKQRALIQKELDDLNSLAEKGYAPKTRILALERNKEQLLGEEGALQASIAEAQTAIGQAELEITRLTKDFREEVLEELRAVETEISELQEQRAAAADELQRLEIKAPSSGRVLGVVTHTVGGVISPGQPIMHIVPDNAALIVTAQINPVDVDKVSPGSDVRVRFSAFNQRTTPEADGEILTVSADAILDEATGLSHYKAQVELTQGTLPQDFEVRLVPGMPAEVFVKTESRSAMSYFLKPFFDAMSKTFKEG